MVGTPGGGFVAIGAEVSAEIGSCSYTGTRSKLRPLGHSRRHPGHRCWTRVVLVLVPLLAACKEPPGSPTAASTSGSSFMARASSQSADTGTPAPSAAPNVGVPVCVGPSGSCASDA